MSFINVIAASRRVATGSSLNVSGLVSLWDTTSIDASATAEGHDVDIWTDIEGTNDATQTGTLSPELHIGVTGGARQVSFNDSDWLNIGQPANLNFIGGTDEFSIVLRLGDNPPSTGYFISKAHATQSLRQWGIYRSSGDLNTIIGGTTDGSTVTLVGNDLIIVTVSTTLLNMYHDGSQLLTNSTNIGTNSSDVDINIGGRSNGGFLMNGDIEFIAVYNKVLSGAEITAIETEFNLH